MPGEEDRAKLHILETGRSEEETYLWPGRIRDTKQVRFCQEDLKAVRG